MLHAMSCTDSDDKLIHICRDKFSNDGEADDEDGAPSSQVPENRNVATNETSTHRSLLIDNSQTVYIPMRLRCGITVMFHQDIFQPPQEQWIDWIRMILQTDVSYCLQVLPVSVRSLIRRTKIWLNGQNYYCNDPFQAAQQPIYANHTTTHHHVAWLLCARDRPDKVLGIEIYNMYDYIRMRHHWNGSGLLLHEYCHLIHQHVFGLDSGRIQTLHRHAKESQLYNTVLRRDWAGAANGHDTDLAYCMMDGKEFFAEMSVTFLAQHCMFHQLDTSCSTNMEECTPPITEPTVVQRLLYNNSNNCNNCNKSSGSSCKVSPTTNGRGEPTIARWIETVKNYFCLENNVFVPHCNKFYPFTSGQFRHYDPLLYSEIQALWCDVAAWEDPHDESSHSTCTTCRWINQQSKHTTGSKEHNVIVDVENCVESPLITSTINDTVDL